MSIGLSSVSVPLFICIHMKPKEDIEIIYRAALKVFARYGFKKATVEDIAGELGMTKGNLYRYAKNKKVLYQQTVAWALRRWQNRVVEAVADETDPRQQFLTMCRKAVDYLSEDDDFRQVLVHDPDIFPMFPSQDPFEEINANSVDMIRSILLRGMDENRFRRIEPEKVSQVIFLVYKMLIIRTYLKSQGADEKKLMMEMFEAALELLTKGLFEQSV